MNRIFTNIQRKLFKEQIDDLNKCFIVGTGRTGTKFFESLLNTFSNQIICYHEPSPDLYDLAIEKYRWELEQNKLKESIIKSRNQYLIKAVRDKKSYYIESNNNASFIVDDIARAYANVKFIILVRDPRTYIVSALNKSPLNNDKYTFYNVTDHRNRFTPLDFENDPLADTWEDLKRFEKISWYWNKCNSFLYDFHNSFRKSLLVKYEDLFSKELKTRESVLMEIFNFIGIELSGINLEELVQKTFNKSNKTIQEHIPEFGNWIEEDKESLLKITQPMRSVLKY